jgi:NAD(P)-dependent dehydrogenase (short-subunit alcohol dehydrogenase family)
VLVTGGASGIGRCIVDAFAMQGAAVVCVDVNTAALADVAAGDGEAMIATHRCDLTDRASLRATISAILANGALDILINNAGLDDRHAWDRIDEEYWDRCLAINLDQQFFCARLVAPAMVARGSGVIVNLGSVAWMRGRPAMVGYMTAKAGLHGLTSGLARELGPHGVRVVGVLPGAIETERQMRLWRTPASDVTTIAEQAIPVRLDGWDVANLVLFLASDAARGCTARFYAVDAGLSR